MTERIEESDDLAQDNVRQPLALLLCSDLMFAVQLQNIARKAGYRFRAVRPGGEVGHGDVLVVDLSQRGNWDDSIRRACTSMPVVAFGPHTDVESRRRAKAAGATKLLANSNLARELPAILRSLLTTSQRTPTTKE